MRNKKATAVMAAAIAAVVLLLTVLSVILSRRGWYLVLRDQDTGQEYARYRMEEGEEFSVGFIHSVNQTPLTDYYQIRDGQIYVVRTIYYSFGAGVQTELNEGETLEYGEDGSMIISGIDRLIPRLTYVVGMWSDHTLRIRGEEISLRDLCGRGAAVDFLCEYQHY